MEEKVCQKKLGNVILKSISKISNPISKTVNPPATTKEIDDLETMLGVALPPAFKDYLLVLNGQKYENLPLLGYNYFLSINDIIKTWSMMNELFEDEDPIDWVVEDKIKPLYWSEKWIPFTDFEASKRLILDFNPGKSGIVGQIFFYQPGMDYQEIVASSFDEFTAEILSRLNQKEYSVDEEVIEFEDIYI